MIITGLSHIGLPTSHLEASIRFYEKLGFKLLVIKENENGFNYAYMENQGCIIGLPECVDQLKRRFRPSQGAIDHFALSCESINSIYVWCREAGIKILSQGMEENNIWNPRTCKSFMIEAPDGVRLEFQELK